MRLSYSVRLCVSTKVVNCFESDLYIGLYFTCCKIYCMLTFCVFTNVRKTIKSNTALMYLLNFIRLWTETIHCSWNIVISCFIRHDKKYFKRNSGSKIPI